MSWRSWFRRPGRARRGCSISRCASRHLHARLCPLIYSLNALVCHSLLRQGDYYRYLSEFAKRNNVLREHYASLSLTSYTASYKHALHTLEAWHPTRLGLALNFAVYFRDVKSDPERACHLAKFAFDEAVAGMLANRVGAPPVPGDGAGKACEEDGALSEKTFRDCVVILSLLKDDMLLWAAEMGMPMYVEGQ